MRWMLAREIIISVEVIIVVCNAEVVVMVVTSRKN